MKQPHHQAQRLPSESLSESDDIQDSAMFVVGPAGGATPHQQQTESLSSANARSTTPATTATTATAQDDISSSEELEDDDIRDSTHPFTKLAVPEEVEKETFAALADTSDDGGQPIDGDSDIGDSTRTGEVFGSLVEIGEGLKSTASIPNLNLGSSSAEASATSTSTTSSENFTNNGQMRQQKQHSSISTNQTANMVAIAGSPAGSIHGDEDEGGEFDEWSSGDEGDSSSYDDEDDDSSSSDSEMDSDDSGEEFYENDEADSSIEESSGSEYDQSYSSDGGEDEVASQQLDDSYDDEHDVHEDLLINDDEDTTHITLVVGRSYSQSQLEPSMLMSVDSQETPRASNKSPRSNNRHQVNRPRRRQSDEKQDQSLWQSSGGDDGQRAAHKASSPKQSKKQQHQQAAEVGYLTPPSGSNFVPSIGAPDLLPVAFDDDDRKSGLQSSDDDDEGEGESNKSASSIDSDLLQLMHEGKLEGSSRLVEVQMETREQLEMQQTIQLEQPISSKSVEEKLPGGMECYGEEQAQPHKQTRPPQGGHSVDATLRTDCRSDDDLSNRPRDESFASIDSDLFDVMKDTELDGSSTLLDVQIQRQQQKAAVVSMERDEEKPWRPKKSNVVLDDKKAEDGLAQQKIPDVAKAVVKLGPEHGSGGIEAKETDLKQSKESTDKRENEELESFIIGDDKEGTSNPIHLPVFDDAEDRELIASQVTSNVGGDGDEKDALSKTSRRQDEDEGERAQPKQSVVPAEKTEASPDTGRTKTVETLAASADSSHSIDLSTAVGRPGNIPELSPKQQGEKQILEILLDKEPVEEAVEQGHDSDSIMLGVWSFCAGDDENVYEPNEPPSLKAAAKTRSTTATDAASMAVKVSSNHSERTEITSNVSPGDNQKKTKNLKPSSPAKKLKKAKKKKKKVPTLPVTTETEASSPTATANIAGPMTTSLSGELEKLRTKKKVAKRAAAVSGVDPVKSSPATEAGVDVTPTQPKRKLGKKLIKKAPKSEGDGNKTSDAINETSLKKKKRKKKDGVAKKRGKRSDYEPKDGDEALAERSGGNAMVDPSESTHENGPIIVAGAPAAETPTQPLLTTQRADSPKPAGLLSGFLSTNSKPSRHIRKGSDNSSVVEMLSPLLPVKKTVSPAPWDMGDIQSTPKKVIKGLLDMFPRRAANAISLNPVGESPPSSPRPGMLKRAASVPNFNRGDSGSEALPPMSNLPQLGTPPQSAPSKVNGTLRSGNTGNSGLTVSKSFSSPGNATDSRKSGLIPQPPLLSPSGKSKKDPKPSSKKAKSSKSNKKKVSAPLPTSTKISPKRSANDVDSASSVTSPSLAVPKKSRSALQAKWGMHSFHCKDNETLTRLRVERIERQIQEIKLQTQSDIQCHREEMEKQQTSYRRKIENIDDPIKALSYLLVDVVKQLRDQQQSLLEEKSQWENDIKSELSVQAELTKEAQEINERTTQLIKDIAVSQHRSLRLATYIESLNNLQDAIRAYFPVDGIITGIGVGIAGESENNMASQPSPPHPDPL